MDIDKLYYFVTVAESKNITHAAELLHISQPALSKSIKSLEEELGVKAFERTGNKIILNENGVVIYNYAKKVIADTRNMKQKLLQSQNVNETIRIVHSFPYGEPVWLYDLIKAYETQNPNVIFKISQVEYEKIGYYLRSGKANIAVTSKISPMSDLIWRFGPVDQLGILMSKSHSLTKKEHIYVKDLKEEKFFCPEHGSDMGNIVRQFCLKEGFEANVVFEGSNAAYINENVNNNKGIAVLSTAFYQDEHVRQKKIPSYLELDFRELEDDFCYRECGIAVLKNARLSAATRNFYEQMLDYKQNIV